jgi:hypothetical protein
MPAAAATEEMGGEKISDSHDIHVVWLRDRSLLEWYDIDKEKVKQPQFTARRPPGQCLCFPVAIRSPICYL